jgi:hypothetical protein
MRIAKKQTTSCLLGYFSVACVIGIYSLWSSFGGHVLRRYALFFKDPPTSIDTKLKVTSANTQSVSVWDNQMPRCRGIFTSEPTIGGPPEFMIRDVVADYRHNSVQELSTKHPGKAPFRRVVAYLSVTPPGNGKVVQMFPVLQPDQQKICENMASGRRPPRARLTHRGKEINEVAVKVDYILGSPELQEQCSTLWKVYRDPDEWQIYVSIWFPGNRGTGNNIDERQMDAVLSKLETKGVSLELDIMFGTHEYGFKEFSMSFLLGCISGLIRRTALPNLNFIFPVHSSNCNESTGAFMISGGTAWGGLLSPSGRGKFAHFAARALLGYLRFDAVAIGVTVVRTISHIQDICGSREICILHYEKENSNSLTALAGDIDNALNDIGVPASLRSKVILFPFCRLGSDYNGSESLIPCLWSRYRGQEHYGYLSYTLFAPYVKWVTSMDIDETLGDTLPPAVIVNNTRQLSAAVRFDSCGKTDVPGALWFRWLDFKAPPESADKLTTALRNKGIPKLKSMNENNVNITECYSTRSVSGNGKTTISCASGMGFRVHRAVLISNTSDLRSLHYTPEHEWDRNNTRVTSSLTHHDIAVRLLY